MGSMGFLETIKYGKTVLEPICLFRKMNIQSFLSDLSQNILSTAQMSIFHLNWASLVEQDSTSTYTRLAAHIDCPFYKCERVCWHRWATGGFRGSDPPET